jgi:hypothetical protein
MKSVSMLVKFAPNPHCSVSSCSAVLFRFGTNLLSAFGFCLLKLRWYARHSYHSILLKFNLAINTGAQDKKLSISDCTIWLKVEILWPTPQVHQKHISIRFSPNNWQEKVWRSSGCWAVCKPYGPVSFCLLFDAPEMMEQHAKRILVNHRNIILG